LSPKKFDPNDVDAMVDAWNRFGPTIWSDDRTLIQDYLSFLFTRDRLETTILAADPETAATLRMRIAAADDRLQTGSEDVDPGLAGRYRRLHSGWWWHRTPRELGYWLRPELDATLRNAD
jgi:hypothetical protein